METRRVPPAPSDIDEVPEADAAEQQASIADLPDEAQTDGAETGGSDTGQAVIDPDKWDAEAVDPDDERVVALDEDEYR